MADTPKKPEKSILTPRLLFLAGCGSILGGWIGMKSGLAWEKAKYGSIIIDDIVGSVGAYFGIMVGGFIGGSAGVFTDIIFLKKNPKKAQLNERVTVSKSLELPSDELTASQSIETGKHVQQQRERKTKKPNPLEI